jgi:hypothetical protein
MHNKKSGDPSFKYYARYRRTFKEFSLVETVNNYTIVSYVKLLFAMIIQLPQQMSKNMPVDDSMTICGTGSSNLVVTTDINI